MLSFEQLGDSVGFDSLGDKLASAVSKIKAGKLGIELTKRNSSRSMV